MRELPCSGPAFPPSPVPIRVSPFPRLRKDHRPSRTGRNYITMGIAASQSEGVRPSSAVSPFDVAVAGWIFPGLGYWLIGHRGRGMTVGVTIVALFALGLLVGGVRVLEVPTYNRLGQPIPQGRQPFMSYLLREVQTKPWSVAQVMTGPVAFAGATLTVWASKVPVDEAGNRGEPLGVESHARINEIGVLYTAVAGMLNLLAIIDSAHRAHKLTEGK